MDIPFLIIVIIISYFFTMFVGIRLIVPFMGFGDHDFPKELPGEILKEIERIKLSSKDKFSYLDHSYNLVRKRWAKGRGTGRFGTIKYFNLIFRTNLSQIWDNTEFAHCNTLNYVLSVILLNSGYFDKKDIKRKHVFCNGIVHQYLKVRIGNNEWIDADPSNGNRKYPLGKHLGWFI